MAVVQMFRHFAVMKAALEEKRPDIAADVYGHPLLPYQAVTIICERLGIERCGYLTPEAFTKRICETVGYAA